MKVFKIISLLNLMVFATAAMVCADGKTADAPAKAFKSAKGWYLTAGLGHSSLFIPRGQREYSILGGQFSMALGYDINARYAVELGALISLNYGENIYYSGFDVERPVDGYLWNSNFFLALKRSFPSHVIHGSLHPYLKLAAGGGTAVAWLTNLDYDQPEYEAFKDTRINHTGALVAMTVGGDVRSPSRKRDWFVELTALMLFLEDRRLIKGTDTLPEVAGYELFDENERILQIALTIGLRLNP